MGNRQKITTSGMLVTAAMLFGSSYSYRKMALLYMGPFFFNVCRFFIGFVLLFSAYLIIDARQVKQKINDYKPIVWQFKGGLLIGLVFSAGCNVQQLGLITSDAGKCGFISALYILFTPIISSLILRKRIGANIWTGAVIAAVGLFFISAGNSFHIVVGDVMFLIAAIFYAIQILIINYYITYSSPLFLVSVQMFVCSISSLALSLFFESGNTFESIIIAIVPILYTSVLTIAVGNLLQFIAQKRASPSVTAITLSLESVFAAIFAAIILHEHMNTPQVAGCCLIFAAIIISQLERKPGPPK